MRLPNKGKQCLISMFYIEPLMNAEILCNFTPQFPCASKPPPRPWGRRCEKKRVNMRERTEIDMKLSRS